MPPKRQSQTTTTTKRPRKKQKTPRNAQEWEDAESTLELFSESFCKSKADFAKRKADEEGKAEERRKQLESRDAEIESLRSQLQASRLQVNKEVSQRESIEAQLQSASDAKDIAEKTFTYRLSAKDKMMGKLHDDVRDLKKRLHKTEYANQGLLSRISEDEMQRERRQQLIDATGEVKTMFADIPVQKMGQVGEALRKMEVALEKVNEPTN